MNIKYHIATGQYEFAEVEFPDVKMSQEQIVNTYKKLKNAFEGKVQVENSLGMSPGPGLDTKTFNKVLDSFSKGEAMDSEEYAQMNVAQWAVIQEIKKSQKRLKVKNK